MKQKPSVTSVCGAVTSITNRFSLRETRFWRQIKSVVCCLFIVTGHKGERMSYSGIKVFFSKKHTSILMHLPLRKEPKVVFGCLFGTWKLSLK